MEFTFLRKPNFFPNRSEALTKRKHICIGTKSRNLGDALLITPLARALKKKHPDLAIRFFGRGFNPVAFYNNPFVQRRAILPDIVFGDDCLWGNGHIIELMQNFFESRLPGETKPEIYLTRNERLNAEKAVGKYGPFCVVHTSGFTWKDLMPIPTWERLLLPWTKKIRFIQVGIQGDQPLTCAEPYFLPKSPWSARQLFAIMERATGFVGIDSGPMHVARAFELPSWVAIRNAEVANAFTLRKEHPHFLFGNWKRSNWYEANTHVSASDETIEMKLGNFLEKLAATQ